MVLSLATFSLDITGDIPKVSYSTGLDRFMYMCYTFLSASILECAWVHYFTKRDSGDFTVDPEDDEQLLTELAVSG